MSKRGKGKNRGRGGNPKGSGRRQFEADDHDVEVFKTFELLNENSDLAQQEDIDSEEHNFDLRIISMEWIKQMEAHMKGEGPLPTERVNQDLLDSDWITPDSKAFVWGKSKKIYNQILKKKLKYKKDFVVCREGAWDMIKENYDTVEIFRRFYIDKGKYFCSSVDYQTTQVIFVDFCQNLQELRDQLKVYTVQYNDDDEFSYLVDYLEYLHFDYEESDKPEYTYLRVDNRISATQAISDITLAIDIAESEGKSSTDLKIRGEFIDLADHKDKRTYYSELFWSRSTLIIFADPRHQPFFIEPYYPELGHTKEKEFCEYCDESHHLLYNCKCGTVFYCSIRCRIKNMFAHGKHCTIATDINYLISEQQSPYEVTDTFNYEIGLENMGNTCYLSSLYQVIRQFAPFYTQLKELDRKKLLEKAAAGEQNIYPFLQDTFNRLNFSKDGECTEANFILKGMIGKRDSTFSKFNQNDSMEFFQSLLEIITKDAKELEVQNTLEQAMQGGRTYNVLVCKDCHQESKRPEEWSFLCVPLPESIPHRTVVVDFIPLDYNKPKYSESHTYNKDSCQVKDLLLSIGKKHSVSTSNLILTFACSDDIKGCVAHTHMLHEAFEVSNGIKYGLSRLVVFEVSTPFVKDHPDILIQDQTLNAAFLDIQKIRLIAFKFDRMSQSINEYMIHRVKIGAMGIVAVPLLFENRLVYEAFQGLISSPAEPQSFATLDSIPKDLAEIELLSVDCPELDNNLIAKPEPNPSTSVAQDSKAGTAEKPQATKGSTAPTEKQTNSKPAGNKTDGSKGGEKNSKQTAGAKTSAASTNEAGSKQEAKPLETSVAGGTPAEQDNKPAEPEQVTFRDLLKEFFWGGLTKEQLLGHPLLEAHAQLQEFVKDRLWQFKPKVVLRYHNPNKYKCVLCKKPNLHECRLQSSNQHILEEADKLFREVKEKEELISPVVMVLGVLVEEEGRKTAFSARALSNSYDGGNALLPNKMTLSLDYCLENMQKKEDMGTDSLVDCTVCSKKTEREVSSVIDQVPKLLVIQLKRFMTKIDYKTGKTEKKKNTTMVELPPQTALIDKEFELFGVVNHYGEIDKGHYTACVKRPTDQQWFLYDDEKVKPISFREVNTEGAYLLFYSDKTAPAS